MGPGFGSQPAFTAQALSAPAGARSLTHQEGNLSESAAQVGSGEPTSVAGIWQLRPSEKPQL